MLKLLSVAIIAFCASFLGGLCGKLTQETSEKVINAYKEKVLKVKKVDGKVDDTINVTNVYNQ